MLPCDALSLVMEHWLQWPPALGVGIDAHHTAACLQPFLRVLEALGPRCIRLFARQRPQTALNILLQGWGSTELRDCMVTHVPADVLCQPAVLHQAVEAGNTSILRHAVASAPLRACLAQELRADPFLSSLLTGEALSILAGHGMLDLEAEEEVVATQALHIALQAGSISDVCLRSRMLRLTSASIFHHSGPEALQMMQILLRRQNSSVEVLAQVTSVLLHEFWPGLETQAIVLLRLLDLAMLQQQKPLVAWLLLQLSAAFDLPGFMTGHHGNVWIVHRVVACVRTSFLQGYPQVWHRLMSSPIAFTSIDNICSIVSAALTAPFDPRGEAVAALRTALATHAAPQHSLLNIVFRFTLRGATDVSIPSLMLVLRLCDPAPAVVDAACVNHADCFGCLYGAHLVTMLYWLVRRADVSAELQESLRRLLSLPSSEPLLWKIVVNHLCQRILPPAAWAGILTTLMASGEVASRVTTFLTHHHDIFGMREAHLQRVLEEQARRGALANVSNLLHHCPGVGIPTRLPLRALEANHSRVARVLLENMGPESRPPWEEVEALLTDRVRRMHWVRAVFPAAQEPRRKRRRIEPGPGSAAAN